MRFQTRKWVRSEDLGANGTLAGGKLLAWIDEEAMLHCMAVLKGQQVVTKLISEVNFMTTAREGDIIEISVDVVKFGTTSLTLDCDVININSGATLVTVDHIIMVHMGPNGRPLPHGITERTQGGRTSD